MDLYIDESGAGDSFLPGRGHTFVLASNNFPTADAVALKNQWFPNEPDLKYRIMKRDGRENDILCFITDMALKGHSCFYYAINKPFILLIVLVDLWLGQSNRQRNEEFYKNNNAKRYVKSLYDKLRSQLGTKKFYDLMEPLEKSVRSLDIDAYVQFWDLFASYQKDIDDVVPLVASEKENGIAFYETIFANSNQKTMLSVPLTALTNLVKVWQRAFTNEKFSIYHDQSTEMVGLQSEWEARCNGSLSVLELHEAGLTAPLNVGSTDFKVDSKKCVQVELSDMIAGAAADYFNAWLEPEIFRFTDYHQKMWDSFLWLYFRGGVLPVDPMASRRAAMK